MSEWSLRGGGRAVWLGVQTMGNQKGHQAGNSSSQETLEIKSIVLLHHVAGNHWNTDGLMAGHQMQLHPAHYLLCPAWLVSLYKHLSLS